VHEDDVSQALVAAALGRGPAGTYNLAGSGTLPGRDVLRTVGIRPLPFPRAVARLVGMVPPVVPALGWLEAASEPLIMDASKARAQLGWRPRFSSRGALEDTRRALGW
jgi:nucleoside-diphosphate-sugar epimerase